MIKLDKVTLISLAAINFEKTIDAMIYSQSGIKFADSKLITPVKPSSLPSSIKWEASPPLRLRSKGIDDYSKYFIYDIWKHVETEYCLVIQADGYVINPNKWRNDFLEFDYIGAPWPSVKNSYLDPFGNSQRVGNGGFSLRSKKLLETPKFIDIPWDVNKPPYKHMNAESLAEDGNICVHNKHLYQSNGCQFAPVEVAVNFSQELPVPESKGIIPFGFHKYLPGRSRLRQFRHSKFWRSN